MTSIVEGALIRKFRSISSNNEKLAFTCETIQSFRKDSVTYNPAQADDFLSAVLPFIETNLDFVSSHDEWIAALVGIIEDHAASGYNESIKQYSFCFHDSYEKAIFIILSMVETSAVLKRFTTALNRLRLIDSLVVSLGKVIVSDISYATQVKKKNSLSSIFYSSFNH